MKESLFDVGGKGKTMLAEANEDCAEVIEKGWT